MTTLYLIRHAEAEGNLYRRIHGWYDSLITENGYRQIAALAQRFAPIEVDAVYSSDLFRTMTTARAIYETKGLPLSTLPALREIHLGDWEDHTFGDIARTDPQSLALFASASPLWRAPNGESLDEVGQRVHAALLPLMDRHADQTVAVFCHGTAIRQFMAIVQGISPQHWNTLGHSDNTAVSALTWDGHHFTVQLDGDNSHLTEEISTLAKQSWWKKDAAAKPDVSLWFHPLDMEREQSVYLAARQESWQAVHGGHIPFQPDPFLSDALRHSGQSPWGVTAAMCDDELVGILQLDGARYGHQSMGYIPFFYILPAHRKGGLGVQLLGQAISHFRPLGYTALRLRCAPYNGLAQRFYARYGFHKVDVEVGGAVPLDILELDFSHCPRPLEGLSPPSKEAP